MAVSLGDAVLRILGDDAGLQATLQKIQTRLNGLGKVAAAAGAAMTGVFAGSVVKFATAGSAIYDLSKRTGMGTAALSELKYAADQSGASLGAVEMASRRLSSSIFAAALGTKDSVESFQALGLTLSDLQAMAPEEQFNAVAGAVANVRDASTRAALAVRLFGRSGTQILPMLADGAEGLRQMRQEAHELGIVFDERTARQADLLGDSMARLKEALAGVGYAIARQVLPDVLGMLDWAKEMVVRAKDLIPQFRALVGETLRWGAALLAAGTALLAIPKLLAGLAAVFSPGGALLTALAAFALWIAKKRWLDPIVDSFRRAGDQMMAEDALGPAREQVADLAEQINKLEGEISFIQERMKTAGVMELPGLEESLAGKTGELQGLWTRYYAALKAESEAWRAKVEADLDAVAAASGGAAGAFMQPWREALYEWLTIPGSWQAEMASFLTWTYEEVGKTFAAMGKQVGDFFAGAIRGFKAFYEDLVKPALAWIVQRLERFSEIVQKWTGSHGLPPIGFTPERGGAGGGGEMRLAPAGAGATFNITVNVGSLAAGATPEDVAGELMRALRRQTLLGR